MGGAPQRVVIFHTPAERAAFAGKVAAALANTYVDDEDLRGQVRSILVSWGYRPEAAIIAQIVGSIADRVGGYDVLRPLVEDPEVTDIVVNRYDDVRILRSSGWEPSERAFATPEEFMATLLRIVTKTGRDISTKNPVIDGRVPNGPRICATIPPASVGGPTLSIRKFRPVRLGLKDLIVAERPTLDRDMALFLDTAVRARLNIVVSGGTGSGKTTFLGCLMGRIPESERCVLIEDTPELTFAQGSEGDSADRITPRLETDLEDPARTPDLMLKASLRMMPDRIIIGEVRGGEALTMLQAMNTGHEGSMSSVHANTAADALSRLETLALAHPSNLPLAAIQGQIASAINLVVSLARDPRTGARAVNEIAEILHAPDGRARAHVLWRHDVRAGHWLITGVPERWERLAAHWPPEAPLPWPEVELD